LIVVGLDLSLTSLGLCAVPSDWALDWTRIRCCTLAAPPKARRPMAHRIRDLAIDVEEWIRWARGGHDRYEVWAESVPTHGAFSIVELAKLRGVVEHEILREQGILVREAQQSTIRKLFLGKLPAKERKQAVLTQINRMAPGVFEDGDQADAFVVANFGLFSAGATFVALPAPERPGTQRSGDRLTGLGGE
jgi:hypothetical protein